MGGPPAWNEIGQWTRLKKLGQGGFGSVYVGKRNADGKLFAVKSVCFVPQGNSTDTVKAAEEFLNERYNLAGLINEIRTLKKLKSPYIVRYIGCGTSKKPPETNGRLMLDCYLEYLPRGSLYKQIKNSPNRRLEEPFIKAYTKDILRALVYLHFNKIVHGDLKCLNILMDSNNCKVADFGSAKDVRTSFFKKMLFSTKPYRAPEVASMREQTYASDIFSLGCTVVEMATGENPVPEGGYEALINPPTGKNQIDYDLPSHISEQCKDFLSKCFAVDPSSRWTGSALLRHPFITEPSSPRWLPYHIPLDWTTQASILQPGSASDHLLIVPPSDLNSSLPSTPFSPIQTVPTKRRKMDLLNCKSQAESDVVLPFPPAWASPNPPVAPRIPPADQNSGVPTPVINNVRHPPPYQPHSGGNTTTKRNPQSRATQAAIRRLGLAPQMVLAEMQRQQEEVASSVSVAYQGHPVEFPPVAQLEGNEEDTDPLVVQICSEFGIPLPPEYQQWILDPDYDPDARPADEDEIIRQKSILNCFKRMVKAVAVYLMMMPKSPAPSSSESAVVTNG